VTGLLTSCRSRLHSYACCTDGPHPTARPQGPKLQATPSTLKRRPCSLDVLAVSGQGPLLLLLVREGRRQGRPRMLLVAAVDDRRGARSGLAAVALLLCCFPLHRVAPAAALPRLLPLQLGPLQVRLLVLQALRNWLPWPRFPAWSPLRHVLQQAASSVAQTRRKPEFSMVMTADSRLQLCSMRTASGASPVSSSH